MVSRITNGSAAHPVQTSYDSANIEQHKAVSKVEPIKENIQQEEHKELTKEQTVELTDAMNQFLASIDIELRFQFHDQLNEYYVTIVDSKTNEVVREVPPKKMMDMYAAMKDFIGLFVDKKI